MPDEKLSDRDRMDRALDCAEQLADDLEALGHHPQAQLIREMRDALYTAKFNRAVADLARL